MIVVILAVCIITIIWVVWGGTRDLVSLYKTLSSKERDEHDDGWVEKDGPEEIIEVVGREMQVQDEKL